MSPNRPMYCVHRSCPVCLVVSNDCGKQQVKTEGGKYVRIVASDAVNNRNDDFARSAYIVYETSKKATAASQKLNKLRVFHRSKPAGENSVTMCRLTVHIAFARTQLVTIWCWVFTTSNRRDVLCPRRALLDEMLVSLRLALACLC